MWFLVFVSFTAILGYLITPDSTSYCNDQHIEIAAKKPFFTTKMLLIRRNEIPDNSNLILKMLFGKKNDFISIPINNYWFDKDLIYIELYSDDNNINKEIRSYNIADVIYSLNLDYLVTNNKNSITYKDIYGKIHSGKINDLQQKIKNENILNKTFVFGTDRFGRDMLSQLIIGARVSLSVGLISVSISLLIGIFLGSLAGYYRGWVDNLIMWFINVVWSIPTLLLVIAITFALGKGFWQVFIAVGLTMWVEVARVVRGQVLSLREKDFVEAAKALGYSDFRIIFKHILPSVSGAVIVISAANFASAILIEAGLSFLGIGVQPPVPSWGTMIKEHYAYIILDLPYLALLPGLAIMFMVLAFMIIGNGLRDALDNKIKN